MQILRQSTQVIVRVGPFVDVGDGFTPQTDISLAGNEAELLKNASVEVDISGRTWAAVTNCRGWYDLTLTTDDTDTVGLLTVVVQDDSDCLPVFRDFQVIDTVPYDEMFKDAAVGMQGVIEVNNLDHLMKIAVSNRDTMPEVVDDTVLANIMTKTDGDTSDFDHETDSLEAIKDVAPHGSTMVGTDNANTTVPDAAGIAATPAEVATALTAIGLDHLISVAVADEVVNDSIIAKLVSKDATADWSDYSWQTESLEALKDGILANIETDTNELQGLIASSKIAAQIKGWDNIDFQATMKASIEAAVDAAFENAIPASPTADSMNEYIQHLKWALVNKLVVTEATGNVVGYKDDDSTPAFTVAVAFDSDGTDTTRKRLE